MHPVRRVLDLPLLPCVMGSCACGQIMSAGLARDTEFVALLVLVCRIQTFVCWQPQRS
jgi:hypothetical protein